MIATQPTFSTRAISLLAITITAISFLLALPFSSAINITIDYPDEVEVDEEFDVEIEAEDDDGQSYEVKIFVNHSGDNKAMTEIYVEEDDEWEKQSHGSSYYYEFPDDDEFELRVFEFPDDDTTLCVYLKNKNTSVITKTCEEIEVLEKEDDDDSDEDNDSSDDDDEDSDNDDNDGDDEREEMPDFVPLSSSASSSYQLQQPVQAMETYNEEPVVLKASASASASRPSEPEERSSFYTADGKARITINYVLGLVSILFLFLIATRRI